MPSKAPPATYRDTLTPIQQQYSDLLYGWNGTGYDTKEAISISDIAARLNKEYMAVYMGLRAAKAKLWEGSDPNSIAEVESEVDEEGEIIEEEPEEETIQPIDPANNGGESQDGDGDQIFIPAFLKNRRRVTPIPKRETTKPTYPAHEPKIVSQPTESPRFQTVVVAIPKSPPIVEKISEETPTVTPTVTFPDYLGYEASLEWLRNEPSVQAGLQAAQKIPAFTRDDLSIMALFSREYPVLHTAFTRLRKLSNNHPCLDIIHDIYHPDPLLILKKEPELVKNVQACFAHHKRGEYEEFTQSLNEILKDDNIAEKVMEICDNYGANSLIEGLALLIDFSWKAEDNMVYESVSLRDTLKHTNGFRGLIHEIERLPSDVSYHSLEQKLRSLQVVVIPGVTSWPRYKSSHATPITLLALLESLIRQDHDYKKDDEKSTKKLRRKLTDIAG